ncbi:hypothetical protein Q7P35_009966 [Cladosporium inversicolor]
MASQVSANAPGTSTPSILHHTDPKHQTAVKPTNDQTDSATQVPPTINPTSAPFPSQPAQIAILCPSSLTPTTLSTHLLTTHSRLFATLACDASTFSPGTLSPNIDHDAFAVFARWLQKGPIHVLEGDEHGFATDLHLLMRAQTAGEALGAGMFADMVIDEIIGELTGGMEEVEVEGWRCGEEDDEIERRRSLESSAADARAKTHDLEILLGAAAAVWPPGSLGRDLLVDWYVHSAAHSLQNLSIEAEVEIGDLDLAARRMLLGKERQMLCERGEIVRAPYLVDPCRYHEHRRLGRPCYKRSRESVSSRLEFAVRCGVGG